MNDVTKAYDGGLITALNGLSLRVERGESVAAVQAGSTVTSRSW